MTEQNKSISKLIEVLDGVYTVTDLNNYVRALASIKPAAFTENADIHEKIKQELPPKLSAFIEEYISSSAYDLNDQNNFQRIIQEVIYILHKVPVAEMTTPQALTYKQIERICKWWRTNTNKPVILNIKMNPELIAGLTIGYEGKYVDYSLSTWLQDKGKEYLDKVPTQ